jgi:hypothetical protein
VDGVTLRVRAMERGNGGTRWWLSARVRVEEGPTGEVQYYEKLLGVRIGNEIEKPDLRCQQRDEPQSGSLQVVGQKAGQLGANFYQRERTADSQLSQEIL